MPKMAKDFKTAHTVLISAVIWHVDPWPYLSAQQGLLSVWHMGGLFVSVGLKMEVREKKRELQSGQTRRRLDLEKKKVGHRQDSERQQLRQMGCRTTQQ